jgi:hypothetical protein
MPSFFAAKGRGLPQTGILAAKQHKILLNSKSATIAFINFYRGVRRNFLINNN